MSNREIEFFKRFPLGIDLDSPRDLVKLKEICDSCKVGHMKWRTGRKHNAQTFKRRIFLNSYMGEPENSAPNYLQYFHQKQDLEDEKYIRGASGWI
jgi:hypothetical protein